MYKELLFIRDMNDYVIKDKYDEKIEYVIFDNKLSVKLLLERLKVKANECVHFNIINKTKRKVDRQVFEKVKLLLNYLEDAINQCVLEKKQVSVA